MQIKAKLFRETIKNEFLKTLPLTERVIFRILNEMTPLSKKRKSKKKIIEPLPPIEGEQQKGEQIVDPSYGIQAIISLLNEKGFIKELENHSNWVLYTFSYEKLDNRTGSKISEPTNFKVSTWISKLFDVIDITLEKSSKGFTASDFVDFKKIETQNKNIEHVKAEVLQALKQFGV